MIKELTLFEDEKTMEKEVIEFDEVLEGDSCEWKKTSQTSKDYAEVVEVSDYGIASDRYSFSHRVFIAQNKGQGLIIFRKEALSGGLK